MKHELFQKELDTFTHLDIKEFCEKILDDAPDYFFHVAASSTGKYHPDYAQGDGGLMRHTKAVLRFYNHFTSLEQYKNIFTEREIDLGRVSCIAHDIQKSGTEESYQEKIGNGAKKVFTVFDHPLLAAKYIMSYKNKYLNENELKYIALSIGCHMGQWNTDKKSKIELPKPTTQMQQLVHLSDYMASRKDIEVIFDTDEARKIEIPDLETYELTIGKYKGQKLIDIAKSHPDYIEWCKTNITSEPLKSLINML